MTGRHSSPVPSALKPLVFPFCQALPLTGPGWVGPAESPSLQPVHWPCPVLTKEVLDDGLVVFPEVAEGPPAGVAVRYRVGLDPASTGIGEEVLAGVHRGVHGTQDGAGH